MISASHFHSGLVYDDYLEAFGSQTDREKWQAALDAISLSDDQESTLASFTREMRVLCFCGAWCGDCVAQCPILRRFEQACDRITLRFVDRDADEDLGLAMNLCGAPRVPQTIIFSEEDLFVSRYGDRTLARYREMRDQLQGAACASGIVVANDSVQLAVIQQWLDELERAQLMLRTSARLREKHGD